MKMKKVKKVLVAALVVSNVLSTTAPALAHASENEAVYRELTDEDYAEIERLLEDFKKLQDYDTYFAQENVQPENDISANTNTKDTKPAKNYKEIKEKTKDAGKAINNVEKEVNNSQKPNNNISVTTTKKEDEEAKRKAEETQKQKEAKDLENKITVSEQEIAEAKKAYKNKLEEKKNLENKLKGLEDKLVLINKEQEALKKANKLSNNEIKEAQKEQEALQKKLDSLKNKVGSYTKEEEKRLRELEAIYKNEEMNGLRYLKEKGDKATLAQIELRKKTDSTFKDENGKPMSQLEMALKDGENSALTIDNMIEAAKLMIKINEQRTSVGLKKLDTSYFAQFIASVKLEGDKRVGTHYTLKGAGASENLMSTTDMWLVDEEKGFTDPFRSWYTYEKESFEKAAQKIAPGTIFKSRQDRINFATKHRQALIKELGTSDEFGHYISMLKSQEALNQGYAYAKGDERKIGYKKGLERYYDEFSNNTFHYADLEGFLVNADKYVTNGPNVTKTLSPEELLAELQQYKRTDDALRSEYRALNEVVTNGAPEGQVEEIKNRIAEISNNINKLQDALLRRTKALQEYNEKETHTKEEIAKYRAELLKVNNEIAQLTEDTNKKIDETNAAKDQLGKLTGSKVKHIERIGKEAEEERLRKLEEEKLNQAKKDAIKELEDKGIKSEAYIERINKAKDINSVKSEKESIIKEVENGKKNQKTKKGLKAIDENKDPRISNNASYEDGNVKTGIAGVGGVVGLLGAAAAALVGTRKRK